MRSIIRHDLDTRGAFSRGQFQEESMPRRVSLIIPGSPLPSQTKEGMVTLGKS